ncbi:ADP/ATP carrier protein (macronuclear) [Tetrahymena thermophila SB210]|uniref:ADP/ATP translocase n=1 Tax=Tetrahymena thermophila (strain SB210) TaxID=312017 RepID=Q22M57_TETTS|nr:ADP/ATP carrier protein [Tetrahymena thermophila SB210]EAR86572.2 ADP/ATP carrier protein [Tetrahymena thermophila SB210]|eukprot:XP_977163.2 ADP/ATP carrier protein [Tetrahymena thermophila SB210]
MIHFSNDTFQQNNYQKIKKSITQRFQIIFQRVEQKNNIIKERILNTFTKKIQESASNNDSIIKMKNLIEKQESQIIRFTANKSFNFLYRDVLQERFDKNVEQDGFQQTLACNMASGGISGMLSYIITYPIQKIIDFSKSVQTNPANQDENKERLQNQIEEFQRKKMFKMTFFFYSGLYFGFYDTLQQIFPVKEKRDFRLRGWEALLLAKFVSYPGEFIAKKIKAYKDQESKYNSHHSENLRQLIEKEGCRVISRSPLSFLTRLLSNFAAITGYDFLLFGVKEQDPFINSY